MIALQNRQATNAGTEAVKRLRIDDLRNGIPFMINSNDLPERQCYLEYPDGSIKLTTIAEGTSKFITIRVLSTAESRELRQKFELTDYA